MKSEWKKPELTVESFELTQTVAAGCGNLVDLPPDMNEMVYCGCGQTGQGHWSVNCTVGELLEKADTDGDKKISWNEFTAFAGAARNNQQTGKGHEGHADEIVIGGQTIVSPFNS